ncbi:hypothetical protein [Microbacterium sp. KHB019]|uniref:hypothetical protein n=1 Tax=Microbacterium sp. KHB019 TaxID=3129770 RepID=UPI003079FCA6
MSTETITVLISTVSMLLAFAGAFGWMIHRVDAGNADVKAELKADFGSRIDELGSRVDRLGTRVDNLVGELVEVKIAVARIEGTPRRLITGR